MGDMADLLIDQMWDRKYDYQDDKSLTDVFCKYCYKGPFDWEKIEGKWRLMTQDKHLPHHCKQYAERGEWSQT